MVEHKNESLEMDLTGSTLSTKAGGTVMLVVKGAFDMRPPEGLVFIPIGPPRTSEQILVHRRNVALSSAAEAFWAHAARSTGRDDPAE